MKSRPNFGNGAWAMTCLFVGAFLAGFLIVAGCGENEKSGDVSQPIDKDVADTPRDYTVCPQCHEVMHYNPEDEVSPDFDVVDVEFDVYDATEADVEDNAPAPEYVPQEGGFLWPCVSGSDCNSGFCIDTYKWGKVCTMFCETECPMGWRCKSYQQGADVVFLCAPPEEDLCEPCQSDVECGSDEDLCVVIGNLGQKYCSMHCDDDSDCPPDYQCKYVKERDAYQCIPESDSCICLGDLNGSVKACYKENEYGVCYGQQICDGPNGWTECSAQEPAPEECDGLDNDCDGQIDEDLEGGECTISNEYGVCPGVLVCKGSEGWVCEGQEPTQEICDYVDNDCDGQTDEGFPPVGTPCDSEEDEDLCELGTWDCSIDGKPICVGDVSQFEQCNGIDDDCDGEIDEDWPELGQKCDGPDQDLCKLGTYVCSPDGSGIVCQGDVEQEEVCDGMDNDCDGVTDEAYPDSDNDGIADCVDPDRDGDGVPETGGSGPCGCLAPPSDCYDNCPDDPNPSQADSDCDGIGDACEYLDQDWDDDGVPNELDCAPSDPEVYPGATEVCDGKDNDCDGTADEEGAVGCQVKYIDADGDGFGFEALSKCVCPGDSTFTATVAGDCNDSDPNVNPLAPEYCNMIDDNCNGDVDDIGAIGCVLRYRDHDGDDYGVTSDKACVCGSKGEYTATEAGDCDDNNPQVYPGAPEYCNGIDDNCNFLVDEEGSLGCNTYYLDQDEDGYGVEDFYKCLCAPLGAFSTEYKGDCDDNDPDTYPGAPEYCDGKDNDCDSIFDEDAVDCTIYYKDFDQDGWGVYDDKKCLCYPEGIYTATKYGDCDDSTKYVYPGAPEVCDEKDNDCDGETDEGLPPCR